MRQKHKIEILAPAGNVESVTAAVLNGADAVYLGQKALNARQNAENFTDESFRETVRFCHLHGVKVYQTLNTVVFDEEFPLLRKTVQLACEAGVDALIVQDFGVLRAVRRLCPQMRIHASTQMTVHTVQGALLLKELGAKRVVLSRELSKEQIREIAEQTGLEIEVFVHGALCMSVSGQCYMSALIGGRSGNKGSCAGTCRLPFSSVPGQERYDLSLKDNCLAGHFEELCGLGITSLKIEGRMKRPEYVAAAVSAYAALKQGETPDMERLRAVFSRSGFTDGYFTGKTGADMFGYRQKEDVLSATNQVLSNLRETYRKEKPLFPVRMHLSIKAGEPARLSAEAGKGTVMAYGDVPQTAQRRPITLESAKEALEKLGGTVFYLEDLTGKLEEGLMLPRSALNELRREAVTKLEAQQKNSSEITFEDRPFVFTEPRKRTLRGIRARFERARQIPWEWLDRLDWVILPIGEVWRHAKVLLPYSSKIILEPERFMAGTENRVIEQCRALREQGFIHLSASNPAHIQIGRLLSMQVHGSCFLNCTNSMSIAQYEELGLEDMVLSFELTAQKIKRLRGTIPFGFVAYGSLPLMLLKNCPVKSVKGCAACQGKSVLTDRTGAKFRVLCHDREYQELLNSRVLWLCDKKADFAHTDFALLYFTDEAKQSCSEVLDAYFAGGPAKGEFTRGLAYRGIQ